VAGMLLDELQKSEAGPDGVPQPFRDWSLDALNERWRDSEWTPWSGPVGRSLTLAPWRQDPLPYLLDPRDWQVLEKGLLQRASFLDALASDLYGEGLVMRQGLLPPGALHANPAWIWPMVGAEPNDGWLCTAAFDVVRTAQGWTVVDDHLQEPRGLERVPLLRARMAQAFPEILRQIHPTHCLDGLGGLRDLLEGPLVPGALPGRLALLAPDLDEAPSPEFAALAREMGVELVDGSDLAVRQGKLWLRSVEGLLPVRGLLRFLPDAWSDPLELRPDTGPGVPALCQAVREGSLHMANAPGVGVLESACIWPWMDRICQLLLGEPLRLAMPRTRWCLGEDDHGFAFQDIEHRIFKRAYPGVGGPLFGTRMGSEARHILTEKIQAQPGAWVAQERVDGELQPFCDPNGLASLPTTLRFFAAKGPDGWRILPGGFARAVQHLPAGGSSIVCKDLWVQGAGRRDLPSWRPKGIRRTSGEVPSRVAENLWWLGRYAERAEIQARTQRALLQRLGEGKDDMRTLAEVQALAVLAGLGGVASEELQEHCLTIELGSTASDLRLAARNAWAVRERLSDDTARIVERLERDALRCQQTMDPAEAARRLTGVLLDLAALSGLGAENTVRGHGWGFLGLGRRLERAAGMLSHLKQILSDGSDPDSATLSALLEVWDSTLTYRGRYMALPTLSQTADLLLLDPTNPRSLIYQLNEAAVHLEALPRASAELSVVRSLRQGVEQLPVAGADDEDDAWVREHLPERLEQIREELERLAINLETHQFAHVEPAWQGEVA